MSQFNRFLDLLPSFHLSNGYEPLARLPNQRPNINKNYRRVLFALFLVSFGVGVGFCALVVQLRWGRRIRDYNYQKLYENLNPYDTAHLDTTRPIDPSNHAIITSLYSEDFTIAVSVLGHSLTSANVTGKRIAIYLPSSVSPVSLCVIKKAGWDPIPVKRVVPPNGGKGIHPHFLDQFTKLMIWGLKDDHPQLKDLTSVLYLDADTLVRKNFDELWSLPFSLAAVPDMYPDSRAFILAINAGVLFLRPSSTILNDMLSKLSTVHYPPFEAEQSFLNAYWATKMAKLPYIYNANLAIKKVNLNVWESLRDEIKIVHYTLSKPFLMAKWEKWHADVGTVDGANNGLGKSWEDVSTKMSNGLEQAKRKWDHVFSDVVKWYIEEWDRLDNSLGKEMGKCWSS